MLNSFIQLFSLVFHSILIITIIIIGLIGIGLVLIVIGLAILFANAVNNKINHNKEE